MRGVRDRGRHGAQDRDIIDQVAPMPSTADKKSGDDYTPPEALSMCLKADAAPGSGFLFLHGGQKTFGFEFDSLFASFTPPVKFLFTFNFFVLTHSYPLFDIRGH
jgi:hypothetical protein